MGRPLKVCPEEPVDVPYELDLEFCAKQAFETTLDFGVLREVYKIVHVQPQVERLVRGSSAVAREFGNARGVTAFGGGQDALKEVRVV